ncbi:MAG TPA: hypothetical protein VK988_01290 [Acidimicrobiales bacterium]|nr:hypothetical protein [Acidimicrobiales bacterium]
MAEITVTTDRAGHAHVNLGGSSSVEIRHSVELDTLEEAEVLPALGSIVLQFDYYGRLAGIEVTDSAASVLAPALLDGAEQAS